MKQKISDMFVVMPGGLGSISGTFQILQSGSLQLRDALIILKHTITHVARNPV